MLRSVTDPLHMFSVKVRFECYGSIVVVLHVICGLQMFIPKYLNYIHTHHLPPLFFPESSQLMDKFE